MALLGAPVASVKGQTRCGEACFGNRVPADSGRNRICQCAWRAVDWAEQLQGFCQAEGELCQAAFRQQLNRKNEQSGEPELPFMLV